MSKDLKKDDFYNLKLIHTTKNGQSNSHWIFSMIHQKQAFLSKIPVLLDKYLISSKFQCLKESLYGLVE